MNRSLLSGRGAFLALVASGLFGLAACAAPSQPRTAPAPANATSGAQPVAATPDQPLEGVAWRLRQLDGRPVAVSGQDQRAPFLQFDARNRRVSGSGGCNRLNGAYQSGPSTLRIGPVASTRMACLDQGTGERENRFFAVLEATRGYRIVGRLLTLTGEGGQSLAVLEESAPR